VVETIGDPRVVQAIVEESASRLRAEKSQLVSLNIPQAGGKLEVLFRSDAVAAEAYRGWSRSYRGCRWLKSPKSLDFP